MRGLLTHYTWSGLALLVTLGAMHVVVAGDSSPSLSAAARVQRLGLNVERAESVRAVKRVQETYAQYSQFGLWTDMAALFVENAQLSYGTDNEQGRQAIQQYFLTKFGEGTDGLKPGGVHTQMVLRPLINVSADGQNAKGRWWEFSMTGQLGVKAEWAAGIFENEYVRERGVWKISRMRYNPMFAGPYATGWRNLDDDQKIVPYHFTPDETGIPVPDLPASAMLPVNPKTNPASLSAGELAALEQRISVMNDEDKVRNLQNAYGYYMDRKMWDDVTDLFAADGALEVANVGVYDGPKSIRRALERSGPAGLTHGQLNELMQLDMAVAIEPRARQYRSARPRSRVRHDRRGRQGDGVLHVGDLREPVREAERHLANPRDADLSPAQDRLHTGLGEESGGQSASRQGARPQSTRAECQSHDGRSGPGVLLVEPGHRQARQLAVRREDRWPRASAAGACGARPCRAVRRSGRAHHGSGAAARRVESLGRRREHVVGATATTSTISTSGSSRSCSRGKARRRFRSAASTSGARASPSATRRRRHPAHARGRCCRSTGGPSR